VKLRELIDQYVAFRKNLGAKFEANEALLGTFSRFVGESQDARKVKPQQVAAFLNGSGVVTRHWHRKYVVLRVFFRYAVSRGYLPASLLPANVPKRPERFKPYIYSHEELRRLLDCTRSAQTRRFQMDAATFAPSCSCYTAAVCELARRSR
jgi:integrase